MHRFLAAFRRAMPVIFFFITSYFLILLLFGLQYTIAASAITVFFSSRYRRGAGSVLGYLILILHETLIITLATIGSWNIYLGTALNILVPFILVFTQSTQFNPRGYFAYALLYVFLSLMPPVTGTDFVIELVSLWMLTLYMALVIWIWNRVHHNSPGAGMSIPEILSKLSSLVLLLSQTDRKEELEEEFGKLIRAHVVRRQSFSAMSTRDTELENMVSTLLQRFSYMIADYDWHSELDTSSAMELRRLSSFLSETAKYIGTPSQKDQMEHAQELLDSMTIPEGRIRIFSRSIIHMVDFMLHAAERDSSGDRRRSINWHGLMHEIAVRFSSESFEMRLASRLAIVVQSDALCHRDEPAQHIVVAVQKVYVGTEPEISFVHDVFGILFVPQIMTGVKRQLAVRQIEQQGKRVHISLLYARYQTVYFLPFVSKHRVIKRYSSTPFVCLRAPALYGQEALFRLLCYCALR